MPVVVTVVMVISKEVKITSADSDCSDSDVRSSGGGGGGGGGSVV